MVRSTSPALTITISIFIFCVLLFIESSTATTRKLSSLVQQTPLILKYHNGPLLKGNYSINLIWYGKFTRSQQSTIVDFIQSLSPNAPTPSQPSVASWWKTTDNYNPKSGPTHLDLGSQVFDDKYDMGRSLKSSDIITLSNIIHGRDQINIVLTAADVTVEGFCTSRCGTHAPGKFAATYIWVGNSASQCPGQCAWPFHQAVYGPSMPALKAPNGDVGMDGMVINIATLLAGAVTNPSGGGFYQGPKKNAPMEAVSACTGMFGSGAYPGYPGRVPVDPKSGVSYNAFGLNGRKYLLPAMWDPITSLCSTLS
ncbi:hypothetical protein QJS10_CPB19g01353 [Acorus calamus]|uniref:Uncharacterized protein n=1 Tax=Acorus calamus TaxID=4465 RepID=A0AAV9CI01_ACOCL|nr:hypothetical protein QJS10_CPB19g01353 [Acorus calamus]